MRRSFTARLAATFAAVGLIAAAITALLVNVAFSDRFAAYLEHQRDERHSQLLRRLGDAYQEPGRWDTTQLQRLAAVALMDGGTVRIETPDAEFVWASQSDPLADLHQQMMGSGPLTDERRTPIRVGGEVVGVAAVRLPQAGVLPQDADFRASVNRTLIAGAAAAGSFALLMGLWLARRATVPARALTETARRLVIGERTARVYTDRSDEFGEMAGAFNRMADTVEAQDQARRDFAADVAHELRTPLMILRGEIEAMQDGMAELTPAALESLREETLRLGRLVDDVETVARADAAAFRLNRCPTALGEVVGEVTAEYAPMFAERSITLGTDVDEELAAVVDPVRIRQVVTNLMSNAAKFTPSGGDVRVELRADGDVAILVVWNSGPAIPGEDLPHVFDRFYRGSQARAEGSGIGLTVVRDLVEAHGGVVEAISSADRGTTLRIGVPLRPQGAHTTSTTSSPGIHNESGTSIP